MWVCCVCECDAKQNNLAATNKKCQTFHPQITRFVINILLSQMRSVRCKINLKTNLSNRNNPLRTQSIQFAREFQMKLGWTNQQRQQQQQNRWLSIVARKKTGDEEGDWSISVLAIIHFNWSGASDKIYYYCHDIHWPIYIFRSFDHFEFLFSSFLGQTIYYLLFSLFLLPPHLRKKIFSIPAHVLLSALCPFPFTIWTQRSRLP